MRIYLIGYMGSGKSTLGRSLARKLGYDFIDTDCLIEQQENQPVGTIFQTHGEPHFRRLEKAALQQVQEKDNIVVATGGGMPCFHDNMEQMNSSGVTIYLSLTPEGLASRLMHARKERPLIRNKTREELTDYIRDTLRQREPHYQKAQVVVHGINITIEQIIEKLKNL